MVSVNAVAPLFPPQTALLPSHRAETAPPRFRLDARRFPWLLAGGLLLVWAGLWNQLRVDWTINDQYQYGWFVPPLALALLALRWHGPPRAASVPVDGFRLPGSGWGVFGRRAAFAGTCRCG